MTTGYQPELIPASIGCIVGGPIMRLLILSLLAVGCAPPSSSPVAANAVVAADLGNLPDLVPPCEHWWECQPRVDGGAPPDLAPAPGCGKLGAAPCAPDHCDDGLVPMYRDAPSQYACPEPRIASCVAQPDGCGGIDEPPCDGGWCAEGLYVGRAPDFTCVPCP